jgi:hypothetical protein
LAVTSTGRRNTANDEVTVGFDNYHAHYDCPLRIEEELVNENPLALIRAILAEHAAADSSWEGPNVAMAVVFDATPKTAASVQGCRSRSA